MGEQNITQLPQQWQDYARQLGNKFAQAAFMDPRFAKYGDKKVEIGRQQGYQQALKEYQNSLNTASSAKTKEPIAQNVNLDEVTVTAPAPIKNLSDDAKTYSPELTEEEKKSFTEPTEKHVTYDHIRAKQIDNLFKHGGVDPVTGKVWNNDTYMAGQALKHYLNNSVKTGITLGGLAGLGAGLYAAPLATTGGLLGGLAGSKAVDKLTSSLSNGKYSSFNVALTNNGAYGDPFYTEMLNPGYVAGGALAINSPKLAVSGFARTPLGKRVAEGLMRSNIESDYLHALNIFKDRNLRKFILKNDKQALKAFKNAPSGSSYSGGNFTDNTDAIDAYFGRTDEIKNIEGKLSDYPHMDKYVKETYPGRDVKVFELEGNSPYNVKIYDQTGRHQGPKGELSFEYTPSQEAIPRTEVHNIQVFPTEGPITGEVKIPKASTSASSPEFSTYHGFIDAAGHTYEYGKTGSGIEAVRESDIWKFNPEEYMKKWNTEGGYVGNNRFLETFKKPLVKLGLQFIDEAGTPFVTANKDFHPITYPQIQSRWSSLP